MVESLKAKAAALQTRKATALKVAEPTGFEPATSDVTGRRSNQLNYDSASKPFQISNLRSEISNWWARRDSNPQPPPCKGGRLPLTYVPISKISATLALPQGVIVGKASICVKKRSSVPESNGVECPNSVWTLRPQCLCFG